MKKKYIMPHTKVVKIRFAGQLLAGSNVDGNADLHGGGGSSEEVNSLEVEFE